MRVEIVQLAAQTEMDAEASFRGRCPLMCDRLAAERRRARRESGSNAHHESLINVRQR